MAFVHGKNSYCEIDGENLSQYIDNVGNEMGRALSEVTAFGDEGVRNIPGLQNSTFSVSGHYDSTETTGPHAVLSAALTSNSVSTLSFGPGGNSTGDVEVSADVWVNTYSITSAVAEKVSFEAELQVDGTVSFGTFD